VPSSVPGPISDGWAFVGPGRLDHRRSRRGHHHHACRDAGLAKTVARLSVLQLGLDVFAIGDARIALVSSLWPSNCYRRLRRLDHRCAIGCSYHHFLESLLIVLTTFCYHDWIPVVTAALLTADADNGNPGVAQFARASLGYAAVHKLASPGPLGPGIKGKRQAT